jgi:hypothetical protein
MGMPLPSGLLLISMARPSGCRTESSLWEFPGTCLEVRAVTVVAVPDVIGARVGIRQREPEFKMEKWNLDSA